MEIRRFAHTFHCRCARAHRLCVVTRDSAKRSLARRGRACQCEPEGEGERARQSGSRRDRALHDVAVAENEGISCNSASSADRTSARLACTS